MRAIIFALAFVFSWETIAHADIIIGDDPGGRINTYAQKYDEIRHSGERVILTGRCLSACTIVLWLPPEQVCAMPGAVLGFHSVSDNNTGESISRAADAAVAGAFYPPKIFKWFMRGPLTQKLRYLKADHVVRPCNGK